MLFLSLFSCENNIFTSVANPTGDCTSDMDGSRGCYHAPEPTDTYLKDCEEPLNREYWRVFAQNDVSSYIMPRPDGMGLFYNLCEEPTFGEIFETYALCEDVLGPSSVDIINSIPPEDALLITRKLHESLEFVVDENDMVYPWAPPNDIVDVCQLSDSNDEVVATYCETALGYYGSGNDCPNIAFFPSPEQALIIANRLNILYGISTTNP
jgi:hypothetical protein